MIPARFAEHHFIEMAKVLGHALEALPGFIKTYPSPYSCETYARKFREAKEACLRYHYTHPCIDPAKFAASHHEICAVINQDHLLIGGRRAIKAELTKEHGKEILLVDPKTPTEYEVDPAIMEKFCHVYSFLMPRPNKIFFVRNLSSDELTDWERRFDVAFIQHDTNKTIHYFI